MSTIIGVRDELRSGGGGGGGGGGGLKSLARIFSPLLARKSSGFTRILPAFLPENGYLKNSSPHPHVPYAYNYNLLIVMFFFFMKLASTTKNWIHILQ